MDPQTALELVKNGVTLLLLDVPQYTLVGIDTQMFSVGPAFKGMKMIPPGPHFVYYSSSSRDGKEFSPIIGFFVDAGPSEVIVRKWDHQDERLVKVSEDEEERYCQAVKNLEFDQQLGPYNLNQYGDWRRLSNFITKNIIERLEPIGGEITIASENEMVKNTYNTAMEKELDKQLKGSKFATPAVKSQQKGCYYTSIPRVIKRKGIHGQELTFLNLDKTQLLESLLVKDYGASEDLLLGELQFAFIAFLMGQSLEAFLQWKSIVSLLFSCTKAPFRTRSQLFTKFIKVIYYQLKFGLQKDCPDNPGPALLDDSWFSADSFLHHLCKARDYRLGLSAVIAAAVRLLAIYWHGTHLYLGGGPMPMDCQQLQLQLHLLQDFFSLVQEASVVDGDLLLWTRKFKELLESTLGWKFHQNSAVDGIYFEENDEFAPVVEMLDDEASTA